MTEETVPIDPDAGVEFIRSMLPDGASGSVFLASEHPDDTSSFRQHVHASDDFAGMADTIHREAMAGRHVWFNASVFEGTERKKKARATTQAVWTDIDREVSSSERAQLEAAGFTLNESGTPGRLHVWARLRTPIDGPVAAEIGRGLSEVLGGEKDGFESLLRVPGVPNRKPGAGAVRTVASGKVWTTGGLKSWIASQRPQEQASEPKNLSEVLGIGQVSKGSQIVAQGFLDDEYGRNNSAYAAACSLLATVPQDEAYEKWESIVDGSIAEDFDWEEAEATWSHALDWMTEQDSLFTEETTELEGDELEQEIARELQRMRVKEEAKRRFQEAKALESWTETRDMVPFVSLEERLREEIPETRYVVEEILPEEGNVVFSAQDKAGKTTFSLGLVKALADGGEYLNRFPVHPTEKNICYMNVELAPGTANKWLSDLEIQRTDRVQTLYLRGYESWFGIESEHVLHSVAKEFRSRNIGVLIIDPVGPLWDAAGITESANEEVGPWLVKLGQMAARAKIDNVVVVHHQGHQGGHARGASKILGWPDSVWSIRKEGQDSDEKRYFRAYGRDVKVPEAQFTYDPSSREVTLLTPDQAQQAKMTSRIAEVVSVVTETPGLKTVELKSAIRGEQSVRMESINRAVEDGVIHRHQEGRAMSFYPGSSCPGGC